MKAILLPSKRETRARERARGENYHTSTKANMYLCEISCLFNALIGVNQRLVRTY